MKSADRPLSLGRSCRAVGLPIAIAVLLAAAIPASHAANHNKSHAGPCSAKIDAVQARIDARLAALAKSGPAGPEGTSAGMSNQPTPRSVAEAEVKLGDINQHMVRNMRRAMTRARAADAAGNARRCESELAIVQRALGHERLDKSRH